MRQTASLDVTDSLSAHTLTIPVVNVSSAANAGTSLANPATALLPFVPENSSQEASSFAGNGAAQASFAAQKALSMTSGITAADKAQAAPSAVPAAASHSHLQLLPTPLPGLPTAVNPGPGAVQQMSEAVNEVSRLQQQLAETQQQCTLLQQHLKVQLHPHYYVHHTVLHCPSSRSLHGTGVALSWKGVLYHLAWCKQSVVMTTSICNMPQPCMTVLLQPLLRQLR